MKANFTTSMTEILWWEGGYVDHPKDPGGATNMGITMATLRRRRRKPVTKADVMALTRAEALDIYRAFYAEPIRYDDLPAGLDHITLDPAINSGPVQAVRWLQRALGVAADGAVGRQTLAAARAADAARTIVRAAALRMGFLRGLKVWGTFGKGWSRRVAAAEAFALALAAPAPVLERSAAEADARARRETGNAIGAAGGGGGGLTFADLPDWALIGAGALLLIVVIMLVGRRRHELHRAAAFRAITEG